MVRPHATRALAYVQVGSGATARRTMPRRPKPTARPRPRRLVSPVQESGLIVTAKAAKHSAGTKCALDNHSHRTRRTHPASRCVQAPTVKTHREVCRLPPHAADKAP